MTAISDIETDALCKEPPEIVRTLQSVNKNATNGNPLNQQSGRGNQHYLAAMQPNKSYVIYQRNSSNGLEINNSANRTPTDGAAPSNFSPAVDIHNSSDTKV